MSTPAIATEPPKKEFNWKRLFIKAVGFGAGVALMLAVLAGVGIWYMKRAEQPRQWNSKAITATFSKLEFGNVGKQDAAGIFSYVLENNTDYDYRLPDNVIRMRHSMTSNSLEKIDMLVEDKIFIPPHQRVAITFVQQFNSKDELKPADLNDEKKLAEFASRQVKDVDRLVLFDESMRYEIDLPSGWQKLH
jgi:hypothetical protein